MTGLLLLINKKVAGFAMIALKNFQGVSMENNLDDFGIVTIISYEEFCDLMKKTGNQEFCTWELINAIAEINGRIYEKTKTIGNT